MKISQLRQVFISSAKAQEIILVLEHEKPVARQGFYDSELPLVRKFCEDNSLFLVKPRFKIILTDTSKPGQFSNRGMMVSESDPRPGMSYVYISYDEEEAYFAAYHEQTNNIRALGRVLGYPECCISFFEKSFSQDNPDPIQTPTNPYTNITRRHEDIVILSHYPCCSDCTESKAMARRYLKAIERHDPDHAKMLLLELSIKD